MLEIIQTLDNATAIRVLTTIAKAHTGEASTDTELAPEFQEALQSEFELEAVGGSISDGEMARQALQLLAQDPELRQRITVMAEGPPTRFMEPITGLAIAVAVYFVMNTHFEFKYEDGKKKLIIKSEPADREILKGFAAKLLSWIPTGPFK